MKAPVSPKTAPPSPVDTELVIEGLWVEKSPFTGEPTGVLHEIYATTDYVPA